MFNVYVDFRVSHAFVAKKVFDVEKVFGFVVLHCGFPVPEWVEIVKLLNECMPKASQTPKFLEWEKITIMEKVVAKRALQNLDTISNTIFNISSDIIENQL